MLYIEARPQYPNDLASSFQKSMAPVFAALEKALRDSESIAARRRGSTVHIHVRRNPEGVYQVSVLAEDAYYYSSARGG